jgi:hypothetical protein
LDGAFISFPPDKKRQSEHKDETRQHNNSEDGRRRGRPSLRAQTCERRIKAGGGKALGIVELPFGDAMPLPQLAGWAKSTRTRLL